MPPGRIAKRRQISTAATVQRRHRSRPTELVTESHHDSAGARSRRCREMRSLDAFDEGKVVQGPFRHAVQQPYAPEPTIDHVASAAGRQSHTSVRRALTAVSGGARKHGRTDSSARNAAGRKREAAGRRSKRPSATAFMQSLSEGPRSRPLHISVAVLALRWGIPAALWSATSSRHAPVRQAEASFMPIAPLVPYDVRRTTYDVRIVRLVQYIRTLRT